jgi:mitochondrial fission protein ELM1
VVGGGPRRAIDLVYDSADRLLGQLRPRHRSDGGSLLVLGSRRTSAALIEVFRKTLHDVPGLVWAGPDDGRNPYPGVLGWADRLVVTPDSVNMLSEACAVGCPVETFVTAPLPAKIARFHQALRAAGRLQDLDSQAPATATPLRETADIAAELRARIQRRQAQQALD